MSIALKKQIQSEISKIIDNLIEKKMEITWINFINQLKDTIVDAGKDIFSKYEKLLSCIPSIDNPDELSIRFDMLRGQFGVNSEDKFIDILTDYEFEENTDYCKITVLNEKVPEELLFINYNCIKSLVMVKNDNQMLFALNIGEEIYTKYKDYAVSFTSKPSTKTHILIAEQKNNFSDVHNKMREELNKPKTILKIFTGSEKIISQHEANIKKNTKDWGKIIVPMSKAIYSDAGDDAKRLVEYLQTTIFLDHKVHVRDAYKKEHPEGKFPATTKWNYIARVSCIMIDPKCKDISYDKLITMIKEYFLKELNQKHEELGDKTHEEYLQYVEESEKIRSTKTGKYSAIKYNAIYQKNEQKIKKTLAKAIADAKKAEKEAAKGTKATEPEAPVKSNGFETDNSDHEQESKSDKKTKKTKKVIETVKEESEDEEILEEKPKPKAKKTKKVVEEPTIEPVAPAKKKRAVPKSVSRINIVEETKKEIPVEEKKSKKKAKEVAIVEEAETSGSEAEDDDKETEKEDDSDDEEEVPLEEYDTDSEK